jgi:hypothetical protein
LFGFNFNLSQLPRNLDRWIAFAAVLLLLLSSYFLLSGNTDDQNNTREGDAIAKIVVHQNDVRHRFSDQTRWVSIEPTQKFYEQDSVFTGEKSQAEILFTDGSRIKMSPNSLITIKKNSGRPLLDLQTGSLSGIFPKGSRLVFLRKGKLQEINTLEENTEIKVQIDDSGATTVAVLNGKAELPGFVESEDILLQANEVVTSSSDGSLKKDALPEAEPVVTEPQTDIVDILPEVPNEVVPAKQQKQSHARTRNLAGVLPTEDKTQPGPTTDPTPTLNPPLAPSPTQGVEDDSLAATHIEVSPSYQMTTLRVSDGVAPSESTISSSTHFGLSAAHVQNWNSFFSTYLSAAVHFLAVRDPNEGEAFIINNSSPLTTFGFGTRLRIFPRMTIELNAEQGKELFTRVNSTQEIAVESVSVFSAGGSLSVDFLKSNFNTLGLSASGRWFNSADAGTYQVDTGTSYGASLYLKRNDSFQTELSYYLKHQNSSGMAQREQGLQLQVRFFFPIEKQKD